MSTASFFSDAQTLIDKGLDSLPLINPGVRLDKTNKIVYRCIEHNDESRKVSLISGGGSGHEPGFAGYVGKGLLDASIAGTMFASPSSEQIRRAVLSRAQSGRGVLVLTMNYTGDVLNFGLAVEKARAHGIASEMVVVADDVAVGRAKGGKVGRRGIAGTVLVMKILGALAERGGTLEELHQLGQTLSRSLVSIGASLVRVTIPGRDAPDSTEQVPAGEVEVGMGIHNESGIKRTAAELMELVKTMLSHMLDPQDEDRHFIDITPTDHVVLLINNLGGLSPLEVSAISNEVFTQLQERYNVVPVRVLCGTFLTSLNAPGWSVSLLKVFDTNLGPGSSLLELLDAPAQAPAWPSTADYSLPPAGCEQADALQHDVLTGGGLQKQSNLFFDPEHAAVMLSEGLLGVIAAESEITPFDTIVGDGDCGIGFKRGSEAILEHLSDPQSLSTDPVTFLNGVTGVVENTMDGTSGAIIAIFLSAISAALRGIGAHLDPKIPVDVKMWTQALQSAVQSLRNYTPANLGDRTMLDSLIPFIQTLESTADIQNAAQVAEQSAEATKYLEPRLGRTTYIGSRDRWIGIIPDPGAVGLAKLFVGMASAC